ncbi:uncharacterized protein LOC109061855 [Cyprinus carpio]|uniref:Uncharacterized protein LOC109061855 n=1 Tax=Cyprinus carpio TaxID=7962 RepID=A0A9R0B884_CYPCA|nr:uncharacterized protein LOC109061855 [Cyprinus carpio]
MSFHNKGDNEGTASKISSSSAGSSCVSIKSDQSTDNPPNLNEGTVTSYPRSTLSSTSHYQTHKNQDNTEIALKKQTLETGNLQRVKDQHKTSMKNKYGIIFEGIKPEETLLNRIYTQLYIIEGEREGVNEEHEVLQMEKTARTQHSQDTPIDCKDIFKASAEKGCEEKEQIKTVFTKGIGQEEASLCRSQLFSTLALEIHLTAEFSSKPKCMIYQLDQTGKPLISSCLRRQKASMFEEHSHISWLSGGWRL